MKIPPVGGNSNTVNSGPKVQNTRYAGSARPDSKQPLSRQERAEKEADPKVLSSTDRELDEQVLQEGTEKLNEMTRIFDRSFHFEIHEKSKRWMVQVINTETGEVVREIPPEKILDMVARLDQLVGLIVDERR